MDRSNSHKKNQLNTLSLFSGGGGMDLGFSTAGFNIVCATDLDPFSCKTLQKNHKKRSFLNPYPVIEQDITQISTQELLEAANLDIADVNVVVGGPPCQAFSVFGKRKGLGDPRGNLVWDFIRIIKDIQPKVFVLENVEGLQTIHNGDLYKQLSEALSIDGMYSVSGTTYQVADFGIPQSRKRIFFIGHKNKNVVPDMKKTHSDKNDPEFSNLMPYRTVKHLFDDLPEPGVGSGVPNHIGRNHSERIIERYRNLNFGQRDTKTRINKLHPDRPSFTIIVGSDAGGGKGHIHPYDPREVTPRESARVQTFPDWWEFHGTGRHVIRQVGNAVPPLFAALLANHLLEQAFGIKSDQDYQSYIDLLDLHFLV
jgi:DNA (cytosine-5)-methyltransferase 1